MKTILLLLLVAITGASCSDDDKKNCDCIGEFYNEDTGQTEFVETDCDRTPPSEGFVFVQCVDEEE